MHAMTKRSEVAWTLVLALSVALFWPHDDVPAAERGAVHWSSPEIGKSWEKYGASEAVRAGDFLFIGGLVAADAEGKAMAPHDGAAQAKIIYDRVQKILEANGGSARNIVSETLYITDWQRWFDGAKKHRIQFYDKAKAAYPAATGIEIQSLVDSELVFEVALVAYLGED